MGLKSGSRDAGLDEEEDQSNPTDEQSSRQRAEPEESSQERPDAGSSDAPASGDASTSDHDSRPRMDSIPYKLRRDRVNEGREQVPYFLRQEVIDREDELQDTLEDMLDETVYKSDYREAAMVLAQRNPELIADVLREWGYDLESV